MRGTTHRNRLGVNDRMSLCPLKPESSAGKSVERRKQEGIVLRSKGLVLSRELCPAHRLSGPAGTGRGWAWAWGLATLLDVAEAAESRGPQVQALGYPGVSRGTCPWRPSEVLSLWVQSWGLGQWEQEEEGFLRDCTPC